MVKSHILLEVPLLRLRPELEQKIGTMGMPRQTEHYGSRRAGRKTALDYDYPRMVSFGMPESVGVLAE